MGPQVLHAAGGCQCFPGSRGFPATALPAHHHVSLLPEAQGSDRPPSPGSEWGWNHSASVSVPPQLPAQCLAARGPSPASPRPPQVLPDYLKGLFSSMPAGQPGEQQLQQVSKLAALQHRAKDHFYLPST